MRTLEGALLEAVGVAREQVQAPSKENVLDALSRSATSLREKLGENIGLRSEVRCSSRSDNVFTGSFKGLQHGRQNGANQGQCGDNSYLYTRGRTRPYFRGALDGTRAFSRRGAEELSSANSGTQDFVGNCRG